MIEITQQEIDAVSGAGKASSMIAFAASVYDGATDFASGFWQGAKDAYGIR